MVDRIKAILFAHQPFVKQNPACAAMEVAEARMLVKELPEENPTLSLSDWGTVTHALACAWRRMRDTEKRRRILLDYRWIKMKLAASPEVCEVWAYWTAVERADEAAKQAQREADRARQRATEATAKFRKTRERG